MLRKSLAPAAATLLAVAAAACAPADDNEPEQPEIAPSLTVVAAFYPLEFVANRVGGDQLAVSVLAPPGVEAHDLELTPAQVAEISDADLVVYLTNFQPAVDAAVDAHANHAFDVTTVVELLETTGRDDHGHDDNHDDDDHDDDDHEDDDHDDDHAADDDHDHGPEDPHVWLDPQRLATIADELAAELSALDADNADEYAAGATALRAELAALDSELTAGLAACERREIVVSHAAFGYLADRYDLRQVAITGLSPEDEPSPQRLQEVINQAQAVGATTIFFEVLVAPDVAETIAREVGAETAVLDPIEGLAPGSDEDYLSLMRQNLATLQTALGCT